MNLVSRFFSSGDRPAAARRPHAATSDYIDLSDYAATQAASEGGASTYIRVAELKQLDDLRHYAAYLYDGNVLVLDFRPVVDDEVMLRRLTNELRKIAQDVGGDIAGLGEHHIIVTPAGIRVDRRKATPPAEEVQQVPVRTSPSMAMPRK